LCLLFVIWHSHAAFLALLEFLKGFNSLLRLLCCVLIPCLLTRSTVEVQPFKNLIYNVESKETTDVREDVADSAQMRTLPQPPHQSLLHSFILGKLCLNLGNLYLELLLDVGLVVLTIVFSSLLICAHELALFSELTGNAVETTFAWRRVFFINFLFAR